MDSQHRQSKILCSKSFAERNEIILTVHRSICPGWDEFCSFFLGNSPVNLTSCLTCHPLTNGYKLEADCILTLCQFVLKTIVCTIKKSTHPSCNPAYKNSRFMFFPKTCAAVMKCATVVWPLVWTLTLTVSGVNCFFKNSYQQAFFMYFKAFSVWYIWYVLKENTDKVNGLQWY